MSFRAAYSPDLAPTLQQASEAYRRHDDPAFRAYLEKAVALAPHRLDLQFNLAHHHIQTENPGAALDIFESLAEKAPTDLDALACLAHWARFCSHADLFSDVLDRLYDIKPALANDMMWMWEEIDRRLDAPVRDALPDAGGCEGPIAIVTLGLVLNPDGSMRPALIERLEKTLEAAAAFPGAPIIVSGGVPKSGRVEAVEMRRWLVERGVGPARILEEGYARDLLENIVYARQILDQIGAGAAIVITSANNVRRAGAALAVNARVSGSRLAVPDAVAASGRTFESFKNDGSDRLKLYRDAIRAYGVPMMRTFPELVER